VVRRQIDYGRQRGVPWGLSESGYNAVDVHLNYQYRAFGVPGLGLKRGLAEDSGDCALCHCPALMVDPEAACRNLERLAGEGCEGAYGLYEAVDYTPSGLPRGATSAIVRQFMAHHEGMSLLSLAYLLLDRPMHAASKPIRCCALPTCLLQERVPKACATGLPARRGSQCDTHSLGRQEETMRVFTDQVGGARTESALQRPVTMW